MFELTLASRTTAFSVPTPVLIVPPSKVTVPENVDTPTVYTLPCT